jgi:hypothetical protein
MVMNKTALAKKKPAAATTARGIEQVAAGEFKAKCLRSWMRSTKPASQ